jgi:Raf kinase inhibitor-like YbhB/YbcL family protein
MNLTSPTFQQQKQIPVDFTCAGESLSPPLNWSFAPEGTKSYALVMDDPNASQGAFTHWILYNIPAKMNSLPEGFGASGQSTGPIQQGLNSAGKTGYSPPCPPEGQTHEYYIRLYALDTMLNSQGPVNRDALDHMMQGHILDSTSLEGFFGRLPVK